MARYTAEDFEASKFLGNAVGNANPFMRKIACMGDEYRELAGYLEAVNKILALDPKALTPQQKKLLETVFAIVQALGQSVFKMDIVSHLSMKIKSEGKISDAH